MITHDQVAEVERFGIEGERGFTMKASGKGFSILIDKLYSNKVAAVVRELCCNARDSHVAAGKANVPIRITIPNAIDHNFVVYDEGTGLCEEDVHKYLGGIFESSKENSNDFVGTLGLGSKSPFALTDSYTIESRFNGIKYMFLAMRSGKNREPALLKTGEEPTDEPNGITFSVPVSDYSGFEREILNELMLFETHPIITNREDFQWGEREVIYQNDHGALYSLKGFGYRLSKGVLCAVMGGVIYPIETSNISDAVWAEKNASTSLVTRITRLTHGGTKAVFLNFPIGAVDIQPSREGLSYDEDTQRSIVEAMCNFTAVYDEEIVEELDSHQTFHDLVMGLRKVHSIDQYIHESPVMFGRVKTFPNYPSQIANGGPETLYLSYVEKHPMPHLVFPMTEVTRTTMLPDEKGVPQLHTHKYKVHKFKSHRVKSIYSSQRGESLWQVKRTDSVNYASSLVDVIARTDKEQDFTIVVVDKPANLSAKLNKHFPMSSRTFEVVEVSDEWILAKGGDKRDIKGLTEIYGDVGVKPPDVIFASDMTFDKAQPTEQKPVALQGIWGIKDGRFFSVKTTEDIPMNPIIVLTEGNKVQYDGKVVTESSHEVKGLKSLVRGTEITIFQIQKTGMKYLKYFEEKNAVYLHDFLRQTFTNKHLSMEYRLSRRRRFIASQFDNRDSWFVDQVKEIDPDYSVFALMDEIRRKDGTIMSPYTVGVNFVKEVDRLHHNVYSSTETSDYKLDKAGLKGIKLHSHMIRKLKEEFSKFSLEYGAIEKCLGRWPDQDDKDRVIHLVGQLALLKKYKEKFGEI